MRVRACQWPCRRPSSRRGSAAPSTARAASASTSVRVGWAWTLIAISAAVPSTRRANVGSASRSPACGPMMCAPSSSPLPASATSFAKPSISPTIVALPSARNGKRPVFVSCPAACASSSVQPDRCDLRPAERDPRHEVHAHRLGLVAGQVLDGDDGLVAGDVREGEAGDDVADRVQVRRAGAHELVDLDVAAIDLDALDRLETDPSVSGRRPTATRMTSTARSVRFDPSLLAIWKVTSFSPFLSVSVSIVDARCDDDAALAEDPRQLLADLRILERHDPIQRTRRGSPPRRSRGTCSPTRRRSRRRRRSSTRLGTSSRVRASSLVMIRRPSGSSPGRERGARAGGEDEVVGGRLDVARVAAGDANARRPGQRPAAVQDGHLVLLQQELDAR